MSASQIIEGIQKLPLAEQTKVIRFAYRLDAERILSAKDLDALARRTIEASDPAEKLKIREELTRGFYGDQPNA